MPKQKRSKALSPLQKAHEFADLADACAEDDKYDLAEQNYRAAVSAFDEILKAKADDLEAIGGRASAIAGLGDLQLECEHNDEALQNFGEAIKGLEVLIKRAPGELSLGFDKALILQKVGMLHVDTGNFDEALKALAVSLDLLDRIRDVADSFAEVHSERGKVLLFLGLARAAKNDFGNARISLKGASEEFLRTKEIDPDDEDAGELKKQVDKLLKEMAKA